MTLHSWTTQTIPETVYLQTSLPHTRAHASKAPKETWALLDAMCMWLVAQKCPSLCDVLDCSPAGSSVHGIFQARIMEWVAIAFSRGSSRLRDRTYIPYVSWLLDGFFTTRNTWETHMYIPIQTHNTFTHSILFPDTHSWSATREKI